MTVKPPRESVESAISGFIVLIAENPHPADFQQGHAHLQSLSFLTELLGIVTE